MALQEKTKSQAFLLGCISGFIYLGGAVYWLNFMKELGPLAFPSWLLLGTYLSLFIGLFALLTVSTGLLYSPFIWVGLELLRAYLLSGFPWALLGYSQFKFLPLIQIADITGVFGISFVLVLINTGLASLVILKGDGFKKRFLPLAAGVFVMIIFLFYGFLTLQKYGQNPGGKEHIFTVIQGNIDDKEKWNQNRAELAFSTHETLSLGVRKDSPDVIIWPETATAMHTKYMPVYWERLQTLAKKTGADLLVGSPDAVPDAALNIKEAYNSVFHFSKDGSFKGRYAKMHLVPFGEFVPFEKQFKFLEKYTAGFNKWDAGRDLTVFSTTSGLQIATPVCWEVIFPGDCRLFVKAGARYLVTVSNDGWYGISSAPHQHFMVLPFRAVENRVSVVRAANTTLSGFVAPTGKIISTLGLFERDKLSAALPARNGGLTFYTEFGDIFSWLCVLVSGLGIFLGLKGKEWRKKKN